MERMVAYCGMDCFRCDAYLATVKGDAALRELTAKKWSELNGVNITPAQLHCMGCKGEGVKTPFCEGMCGIRKCAIKRGLSTCGECPELDTCALMADIIKHNPSTLKNLKG